MKKYAYVFFLLLLFSVDALSQQWQLVKKESRFNFSGMALVESNNDRATLIVVHDNKLDTEERASLLTIENKICTKLIPLKWINKDGTEKNLPVDLESITSIPNMPNNFLAGVGNPFDVQKKGRVYHLRLDTEKKEVRVINEIRLPVNAEQSCGQNRVCDFEGFAVQKFTDRLLAVWADRGRNERASTLFFGELVLSEAKINLLGQTEIKVASPDLTDFPEIPNSETRSVSDLKIDSSGGLFVTSAYDSGATDLGPFASAFYYVGAFQNQNNLIGFNKSPAPVKLFHFKNYKVESFEFVPGKTGGVVFGTDDEKLGASVYVN